MLDHLAPFTEIIFPAVYVLFFLGTLCCLAFAHRHVARQVWLAGFFTTLLAVTLVGMPLMPVVDMHKFAEPNDEERTYYEVRIVDAAGNELEYDDRATPPTSGSRTSTIAGDMTAEYDDDERLAMGEFFVSNAIEHRAEIESGGPPAYERLQPPRYVDDEPWTADELAAYEAFEAVRVYERTITFTDDTTAVESNEEQLLLTVDVAEQTITEHDNP
ncbi:hypothetical protein [Natronococcus amylolyticus]|uniref:hypothetical protein n=1 Tax=Natronococcus amylolyticus TaxID=44470 RepID=UPI001F4C7A17|nr:hypothetical protein [Natronococcus amylolyticus]